jgi:sulfatase-modifying factor enzyme 1
MKALAVRVVVVASYAVLAVLAWREWRRPAGLDCGLDAVRVGTTCVDKYEASVWRIPPATLKTSAGSALVRKIQDGSVTLADLTAAGAVQLEPAGGCNGRGYLLAGFPGTGDWTPVLGIEPPTPGIYAVSLPGVMPSTCISWFQAEQACALSHKRLIRNQEWQRAAAGTPDPGDSPEASDCNTGAIGPSETGSRAHCRSSWGVYDMIGNVDEWVGDWGEVASGCTNWAEPFGGDYTCVGGAGENHLPGAVLRGGRWSERSYAGIFAMDAFNSPSAQYSDFGFRCARAG